MASCSRPLGEVLKGLETHPLEDGDTPMDAVMLIKYLSAEGRTGWALRHTAGCGAVEVIGALDVIRHRELLDFDDDWVSDADDEGYEEGDGD